MTDLTEGSGEFARLWETHDVDARVALVKTFDHPAVGAVVIYTAEPGSPSNRALQRLSCVSGTRSRVSSTDSPGTAPFS